MPVVGNTPFPILIVEGEARERGRQHGELARDQIGLSVERYMARFQHFAGLTPEQAREIAGSFADPIRDYDPDILEEIEGVAEGSGFRREDLLAVNCRSEVMFGVAFPECTSFGLQPDVTATGHTYVGQNWDWAPDIQETIIVLVVKQDPKPAIVLLDEAGMIGRMGMNSAGIALASNTLLTEEHQRGVPYNVLLRGILNENTFSKAIAALITPRRALAANYLFGDGEGQTLDIEASPTHTDIIAPTDGIVTHGNHFEGARLKGRDLGLERFPDSAYRPCRLRDLLRTAGRRITEGDMQSALQDTFGFPNSISRAVDPEKYGLEQLETVASIIFDATDQRFLLHRGAPTGGEYNEFDLAALVEGKTAVAA